MIPFFKVSVEKLKDVDEDATDKKFSVWFQHQIIAGPKD